MSPTKRNPIAGCYARAATDQPAAAPPKKVMKSRRFMGFLQLRTPHAKVRRLYPRELPRLSVAGAAAKGHKRTFSASCIMSAMLGHETVIHRRLLVPKRILTDSSANDRTFRCRWQRYRASMSSRLDSACI